MELLFCMNGVILGFDDDDVAVKLKNLIAYFPRVKFECDDDVGLFVGRNVLYCGFEKDGVEFDCLKVVSDPGASDGNKDLFDLLDSTDLEER